MKTLKEVQNIVGMSRRIIQEYEKAGLAQTPTTKNKYGYLLYDNSHIQRLLQIRFYRELGYEKKEIQEILENPDYDHQSAMQDRISCFKKKKQELDDLIAMAETAEITGMPASSLCTLLPDSGNLPYDGLMLTFSRSCQMAIAQNLVPQKELPQETLEECFRILADMLTLREEDLSPESPQVQAGAQEVYDLLSPELSPSTQVFLYRMMIYAPGSRGARDLEEFLSPEDIAFFFDAFTHFCRQHRNNPADRLQRAAISQLLKLKNSGSAPESPEVRQQIRQLHRFFKLLKLYTPDQQLQLLLLFGKAYGESPCWEQMPEKDRDFGTFILAAISHYCAKPDP